MTFTARLRKAKTQAGLTIAELALWFDGMSKQVMWSWVGSPARSPKAYRFAEVEKALGFLERELALKKSRLPLPASVRQGERFDHVAAIRKRYG